MDAPNFELVVDDVRDQQAVDRLVSRGGTIFHLAATVGVRLILDDPLASMDSNVHGTKVVLERAASHRTKVLIASTSEVYGKSARIPQREDDDVVLGATRFARWSYAASKMLDEFLALAHWRATGLPVVVFRLFNTVGPRQTGRYGMVVPRFVEAALREESLQVYGDGLQSRCFLHVRDAVQAIAGLAEAPEAVGGVFNVGPENGHDPRVGPPRRTPCRTLASSQRKHPDRARALSRGLSGRRLRGHPLPCPGRSSDSAHSGLEASDPAQPDHRRRDRGAFRGTCADLGLACTGGVTSPAGRRSSSR